jgi:hypothetical protein
MSTVEPLWIKLEVHILLAKWLSAMLLQQHQPSDDVTFNLRESLSQLTQKCAQQCLHR